MKGGRVEKVKEKQTESKIEGGLAGPDAADLGFDCKFRSAECGVGNVVNS